MTSEYKIMQLTGDLAGSLKYYYADDTYKFYKEYTVTFGGGEVTISSTTNPIPSFRKYFVKFHSRSEAPYYNFFNSSDDTEALNTPSTRDDNTIKPNPLLLFKGATYLFEIDDATTSHPFHIACSTDMNKVQIDSNGTDSTVAHNALMNSGTTVKALSQDGQQLLVYIKETFDDEGNTKDTLKYYCTVHP